MSYGTLKNKMEENLGHIDDLQKEYMELQAHEQVNGNGDFHSPLRHKMREIAEQQIILQEENEFITWCLRKGNTHYIDNEIHRQTPLEDSDFMDTFEGEGEEL